MNELALFAGAGGGILGGKLLGWRTRCAVEIDVPLEVLDDFCLKFKEQNLTGMGKNE
jgi:hypothetical protein